MKVQLINPPLNKDYSLSLRTGIYAPLNLATLAGYIRHNNSNVEVEILDGEMQCWEILLMKINAPIVGISCNLMTYKSALEIAKHAKDTGAQVILGGPYATSMAKEIITNQQYIDAVVVGDGEEAMLCITQGNNFRDIPNLVYREGTSVFQSKEMTKTNLSSLPFPVYSSLNMSEYFANYKVRYGDHKPFNGSLAISSIKGCKWRDSSGDGCIFCMIPNKGVQYCNPERVWDEIEHFNSLYGVDYFWDVSDSFVDNNEWLDKFKKAKPSYLNPSFEIYGRANRINDKKAELLKDIGVFEVFIGAESGDNDILKNINKPVSKELVLRAINALAKFDIRVTVSFVIGLPGETSQSLAKTIKFSEELAKYNNVIETSTSVMMPIPGSRAFKNLISIPEVARQYSGDLFDIEGLRNEWIKRFTSLSYRELEKATNDITSMFILNSDFAQPKHKYISSPCC